MKRTILFMSLMVISGHVLAATVSFDQLASSADLTHTKYNSDLNTIYQKVNTNLDTGNVLDDTLTEADFADEINPRIRAYELDCELVSSGLLPGTTSGTLVGSVPAGTAYPRGYRINKASATAKTWTASMWTFVDIDINGDFTYSEIAIDGSTPAVAANSIRLARVSTDATQVTDVQDLRTTSCAAGPFSAISHAASEATLHDMFQYGSPIRAGSNTGWVQGLHVSFDTHTTFLVTRGSAHINGKYRAVSTDFTVTTGNDSPTTGGSGLDTGSIAASTTYNVFAVADQASVKGLSISYTTSATPGGVTNYKKIGSIKTDATSLFTSDDVLTTHAALVNEIVTGTFTGDGNDDRWLTIGFLDTSTEPEKIEIWSDAAVSRVTRIRGIPGDDSGLYDSAAVFEANNIQAIADNKFQVGTDASVNQNSTTMYYIAWGEQKQ